MSFITTDDGVHLYFETRGSGPAIVIPNGSIYLDDFAALIADHTLIAYDPRNRGRSDRTADGDISRDVEDVEAVRRHFDIEHLNLVGHSHAGLLVALYAMRYPSRVNRVVQIGPMEPVAGKQYPPELSNNDGLAGQIFGRLGQLYRSRTTDSEGSAQAEGSVVRDSEIEMCRKAWSILGPLYVTDPANASRIDWGRCDLPNERAFMTYFTQSLLPSIQSLRIPEEASKAVAAVLTVHGTKDRSAPYGAGRDWVALLPNARLLTIEGAAHAPWIEAPEQVLGAMRTFFAGEWPEGAVAGPFRA